AADRGAADLGPASAWGSGKRSGGGVALEGTPSRRGRSGGARSRAAAPPLVGAGDRPAVRPGDADRGPTPPGRRAGRSASASCPALPLGTGAARTGGAPDP